MVTMTDGEPRVGEDETQPHVVTRYDACIYLGLACEHLSVGRVATARAYAALAASLMGDMGDD